MKKKKLPSIKSLKSKTWKLMSYKTRRLSADYRGICICITCGASKHWKEIHAGHFLHASKGSLVSYDPRNIHCQCPKCNTYQGGRLIEYTLFIQKEYGEHVIDELKRLKQTIMKRADFNEVIERLNNEIEQEGLSD